MLYGFGRCGDFLRRIGFGCHIDFERDIDFGRESLLNAGMKLAFGALALIALVAGCSSTAQPSQSPTAAAPTTSAPANSQSALPAQQAWQPNAADVTPQAKLNAARFMETAGTWSAGQGGLAATKDRLSAAGFDPKLASQVSFLLGDANAAVSNVLYTQYFGHAQDTASVLTIVEQTRQAADGTLSTIGDNFAVHVAKQGKSWVVTSIDAGQLKPALPTSQLSAAARAVLNNSRITLPAASVADVKSGQVDDAVLQTLNQLSKDHKLFVSVFMAAHPIYVYDTDRRSDHPLGYAVDIGAIDGKLVVDPANKNLVEQVMRQASTLGPYQVGGPYALNGSAFFTDDTHHDHIHLGFAN